LAAPPGDAGNFFVPRLELQKAVEGERRKA
jgi:hypothetical protein